MALQTHRSVDGQIGPSVQRNSICQTSGSCTCPMSNVQGSYELLKVFTPSYLRFMQSTTVHADCPSAVASAGHRKPTKQDIQAHNGAVVQAWDDRTTFDREHKATSSRTWYSPARSRFYQGSFNGCWDHQDGSIIYLSKEVS